MKTERRFSKFSEKPIPSMQQKGQEGRVMDRGQRQSLEFLKRKHFHSLHTAGSYRIYQGLTLWRGEKLRLAIYLRVSGIGKPKTGISQGHHPHGMIVAYKKHKK